MNSELKKGHILAGLRYSRKRYAEVSSKIGSDIDSKEGVRVYSRGSSRWRDDVSRNQIGYERLSHVLQYEAAKTVTTVGEHGNGGGDG